MERGNAGGRAKRSPGEGETTPQYMGKPLFSTTISKQGLSRAAWSSTVPKAMMQTIMGPRLWNGVSDVGQIQNTGKQYWGAPAGNQRRERGLRLPIDPSCGCQTSPSRPMEATDVEE